MFSRILNMYKKINGSLQSIIFVGTISVLFLIIVSQSLFIVQMRYHINDLEEMIIQKENENKQLMEKMEKITTDAYVEKIAREKLGMVKSYEKPVEVHVVADKSQDEGKNVLQSKDKIGIYLKEWYLQLGEWFNELSKKELPKK